MNRREREIEELISDTVASLDCEVWGVEYNPSNKRAAMKIYIDREDGISIEHCEQVSRHVSDLLDVADIVSDAYRLEVSSPGFDRVLFKPEQYEAFVGSQVDLRLNVPFEGRRRFIGLLAGVEDGQAVVQVDDEEFVLPIEGVQRARIVPVFE
ncbi:MAG: ribosome maturation factor RimP [Pseudomonadaceae bacterium]|nr:ribosome maturation factor RimP [Pseudomonadaceae bacterium]